MANRVIRAVLLFLLMWATGFVGPALAADGDSLLPETTRPSDPENCLLCHRFPGLSRLDQETGELRLFFVSEDHYAEKEGPHARLRCTACHIRDEVSAVPHKELTPVNCTTECHLVGGSGVLTRFSHSPIAKRVEDSVHRPEALADLSHEEPLLRPGQSSCLYCHDQPVYRDVVRPFAYRGSQPDTRCVACHTEELSLDTTFYLKHTSSRLQPSRPVMELARACAVCHSNHELTEEMDLHDAVTSYFNSFHGKANLLGNKGTATCMDCHSTETGDAHGMLSAEDPEARTHPDHLASTCRSVDCHPNAVPELSAAAVHLRIDPRTPTPEYVLMVAMVMLIAVTLTLYFILLILEMAVEAFWRRTPEQRHLIALASAVAKHPEGRQRLQRMNVHQRVQHWFLVISFVILAVTGAPLKFATTPGMDTLAWAFGGVASMRLLHRVAAAILIVAFLYHLGYLARKAIIAYRSKRAAAPESSSLWLVFEVIRDYPLMVLPRDIWEFVLLFAYLAGLKKDHPHLPKYHFSQKFEYWGVFWGMVIIGFSGLALWATPWIPQFVGGRALNFAIIVHSDEAFLAVSYIVIAHITAVTLAPRVFPISMGTLTGQVTAQENAETHAGHMLAIAKELGIEVETPPAPTGFRATMTMIVRRTYAGSLVFIVLFLFGYTMTHLWHEIVRGEAVVEVEDIPLRIDASTLSVDQPGGQGAARESRFQRGPLAHFHVTPTWFTPDPTNSCTMAGCHEALPHGEKKEDRAFFNMHSSFIDCQVCHLEQAPTVDDMVWISMDDRTERPEPAILRLAATLDQHLPEDKDELKAQHAELVELLEQVIEEAGGQPIFERWLLQLETARLGGVLYAAHLEEMRHRVHLYGRGEYGRKIGVPKLALVPDQKQREAQEKMVTMGLGMSDQAHEALVEIVHRGIARPEPKCTRCHDDEPELVDYDTLGYSPARAEALRSQSIRQFSNAVEQGEIFYLPSVLDSVFGQPVDPEPTDDSPPTDEAKE